MNFITTAVDVAAHGLQSHDAALAMIRGAAGVFFGISGFNKLFNKGRHKNITQTLKDDKVPFVGFMQWWVPSWELASGVMLTIGFLSAFNAMVLTIICLVACGCEATKRVNAYNPINVGDRVDDYLYLPEVIYVFMLLVTILAGSGRFSVDALLF